MDLETPARNLPVKYPKLQEPVKLIKIKHVLICGLQLNVINNLTKDCNLEIVKCSLTGINCTKLNMSSVTSFVRAIIIQLRINTVFLRTKPMFFYFSVN